MAGDIPGQNTQISVDDFIPVVNKNYIAPHLRTIPTGTRYTDMKYTRAVLMIPQTSATVGTTYIYPGAAPVNDTASIPIPAGQVVYLDARGEWYVRTTSAVDQTFLVIDAGAAGNAQAVISAFSPTSPSAALAPRTMAAGAQAAVGVASGTVIAADSTRKFLYVKNVSTTGQRITLSFNGAAVLDTGITLSVGEWRAWDITTGLSQQALTAIASAASAALEYVTGA